VRFVPNSEQGLFGQVVCICNECDHEWELDTGSSSSTLDQCVQCGSFNVKRFRESPEDVGIVSRQTADDWMEEDVE